MSNVTEPWMLWTRDFFPPSWTKKAKSSCEHLISPLALWIFTPSTKTRREIFFFFHFLTKIPTSQTFGGECISPLRLDKSLGLPAGLKLPFRCVALFQFIKTQRGSTCLTHPWKLALTLNTNDNFFTSSHYSRLINQHHLKYYLKLSRDSHSNPNEPRY